MSYLRTIADVCKETRIPRTAMNRMIEVGLVPAPVKQYGKRKYYCDDEFMAAVAAAKAAPFFSGRKR